jgi:hypothetical protein
MPDRQIRSSSSLLLLLAAAMLPSSVAWACPDCEEGIRRQVRAGIFDESFAQNVVMAALPFGVFAGITAAIHFGVPRRRRHHG